MSPVKQVWQPHPLLPLVSIEWLLFVGDSFWASSTITKKLPWVKPRFLRDAFACSAGRLSSRLRFPDLVAHMHVPVHLLVFGVFIGPYVHFPVLWSCFLILIVFITCLPLDDVLQAATRKMAPRLAPYLQQEFNSPITRGLHDLMFTELCERLGVRMVNGKGRLLSQPPLRMLSDPVEVPTFLVSIIACTSDHVEYLRIIWLICGKSARFAAIFSPPRAFCAPLLFTTSEHIRR